MTTKPYVGQVVHYWHPVKGGRYSGTVLAVGRKWVRLRSFTPPLYKSWRVRIEDIEPAVRKGDRA